MAAVAHHVLLALSVAALAGTALRTASLAAPSGLERLVSAAAILAAIAAVEALLLGLADLGTSPAALSIAAALTWLASRRISPRGPAPAAEAIEAWRAASPATRIALGTLAGAWLAWSAWLLRYPALGFDSVTYHLPEVLAWIHQGTPGTVEPIFPGVEVGNYPLTNEVLVAWSSGIARSFVPAALWAAPFMVLLAASGWLGLRTLGVEKRLTALATAVLCTPPVLTNYAMNGAQTDLPALAWLVAAAALCAGAPRRPVLLVPAIVALGLAVGTKTTAVPLGAMVLLIAVVACRARLRPLAAPVAAAVLLAAAAGGFWYARNLVDHGSPFWPVAAAPWGDPVSVDNRAPSLLDRPRQTVERLHGDYLEIFAGGVVLLAGGVLAPLVARRREVAAASGAAAATMLLWAGAPKTGTGVHDATTVATVRYLLPSMAAAALALALAGRRGGSARVYAVGVLGAVLALNLWQTFDLGFPSVPSPLTPLAGAGIGALLAAVAVRYTFPGRSVRVHPAMAAAGILIAGALLGLTAGGMVERHARTKLFDAGLVRWFDALPAADERLAGMSPLLVAPVAGNDLHRRVERIAPKIGCREVRARLRSEWIVVQTRSFRILGPVHARTCLAARRPAAEDGFRVYGR